MIARNPLPSPSRRWDQLRRDVADFLASPWAAEAARLGWTELDLVVPLLNGSRIVEMTADAAILETPGGARQSYRRKTDQPGRVPVWEVGA